MNSTRHRKVAVSFRDTFLLKIFQETITFLRRINENNSGLVFTDEAQQTKYKIVVTLIVIARYVGCVLLLFKNCLLYDFIGTNGDEPAEDIGALQVNLLRKVI